MVESKDLNHLFYTISQAALYRIVPSVFAISFDSGPDTLRVRFHVTDALQKEDELVLSQFACDLCKRCPERKVAIETTRTSASSWAGCLESLHWMIFRRYLEIDVEEG
jgi:hypothetical protein